MLIAACSNKIKLSKRKFLFLLMIAFVVLWFNFTRWREQVLNYAPETSTKDSFQTTVLKRVQCSLKAHRKVIVYVKMYYSVHQGVSVSGKCYRSIKIFHKTSNCWIVHLQLFPSLSNTFPYSYNVHVEGKKQNEDRFCVSTTDVTPLNKQLQSSKSVEFAEKRQSRTQTLAQNGKKGSRDSSSKCFTFFGKGRNCMWCRYVMK